MSKGLRGVIYLVKLFTLLTVRPRNQVVVVCHHRFVVREYWRLRYKNPRFIRVKVLACTFCFLAFITKSYN